MFEEQEKSTDFKYELICLGRDKTTQKVRMMVSFGYKDDGKKAKKLTSFELEKKAKEQAEYLLKDNYYSYQLIKH